MEYCNNIISTYKVKKGRKRPLDTPKRMIERRRDREGEREKERERRRERQR